MGKGKRLAELEILQNTGAGEYEEANDGEKGLQNQAIRSGREEWMDV